ncbi:hypothetical protein B0H16DRAFT_1688378 [Mycena metata]|uniref:Uncharacterized protein n=1 Tax=Mycena metata TaxID=1033252 RepID=A0AAD7NGU7_9AGAR|nr:hypothetical protein B0H16DRAFT_1688378 [Mycena metata]
MPAVRTEKHQRQWRPTKKRSAAQKANCFGSTTCIIHTTPPITPRGKENARRVSNSPSSPYSSHHSSPTSFDVALALRLRSDKYEKKCRNLTRQVSRAADRKAELEKRVGELRQELAGITKKSSAYAKALDRRLDEATEELMRRHENTSALHTRNVEMTRKQAVLEKRLARSDDRVECEVAKLTSQSLKEEGIISAQIRACVRDIVAFGAPLEGVSKIIHAVAKGLNIKIKDDISTRSASRIILEGGVAAQLQIVDAVKNTDYLTASGDGTSHRHLNYESRFIVVKEKLLALGLTQAPSHTSEEQMAGWLKLIQEMYEAYNESPIGREHPEDFRTFFIKITGMMTDHAADQKKLRGMFKELKKRLDRELRGEPAWAKNGFAQPVILMNKDNDAAANSGSAAAKERAEKVSSRGGVKLCELMGMLLNNKDDKKGQQDSHGVYFCAHEHIGYSIKFPDTSNTRYQCFSEAAAEIIVNLPVYRDLMEFIRFRKMSLAYNHLEKNIWTAINDIRTIIELVVLLWYGQNFSHAVMRVVRSRTSTGGLRNLWDMGPAIRGVIAHLERVILDPDIIMGDNLSFETAAMDGQPWERPEAMYAAHALLPTLPRNELRAVFIEFMEGALETWRRFGSDILGVELTEEQKRRAMMPTTNDCNEGWLGSNSRVALRRAPNASLEYINAKSQYKHNGTAAFIEEKLDTPEGQKFLRQKAQEISADGRQKKRKLNQAEHDAKTVAEHRANKEKSDKKKADEIKAINSLS